MSYEDGWAVMNLEMPGRIPGTEYSVESHRELLRTVTGRNVSVDSDMERKIDVQREFRHSWNYGFVFGGLVAGEQRDRTRTSMGYAEEDRRAPDAVSMSGIYMACIFGLLEIFGWEMMLAAMGTDLLRFGELTNRYALWFQQCFDALAATDMSIVMIHDVIVWTSGAFIHPDWYRKFVFPNYRKYLAPVIEAGKVIIYCSDGNCDEFVDDIAEIGSNGFVMEPIADTAHVAETYGRTHIIVRNHIPSSAPIMNALYYNEVYEELSQR